MSEGAAAGDQGTVALVYLCMEVAGCPTVCRHCWAQGTGYGMMPLADVEWVLDGAHRFCDGRGLGFDAYPMHELAAHPDAARLFGLFNSHSASAAGAAGQGCAGTMFEPWPTTGVPLAVRGDWRGVLDAAAATGTVNLWVAFHGTGEVHDRQVNRRGAFAETCLAIKRAHAMGLSAGCNIFLTTESLPQLGELTATVRGLVDAGKSFETAGYLPTPRSRRNERLRPTLPQLQPVSGRIADMTAFPDRWAGLETRTEAAYVRQALAGDWPDIPDPAPGELALICRPNLDVHSGLAGLYRTRHGNLRTDGIATVLGRALARGREPDDVLWFGARPHPGPAELAACYGDATGLGVHPGPQSARYLWLDRLQDQEGLLPR
ncbi:MAG: hypothetical protein JO242_15230 [Streptosporangiaceae bacterium]|nr:hypothetical protein [Streptosporangiaceae bacterium]